MAVLLTAVMVIGILSVNMVCVFAGSEYSVEMDTCTNGVKAYESAPITITCDQVAGNGMRLYYSEKITISVTSGNIISKVEAIVGFMGWGTSELSVTSGTPDKTTANTGEVITITDINAESVTLSNSQPGMLQLKHFKVYYSHTDSATLQKTEKIEPTCVENGCKEYYYCNGCDTYFEDMNYRNKIDDIDTWKENAGLISSNGHTYGEPTYSWEFKEDGWYCTASKVCSVCDESVENHEITETVKSTGEIQHNPTCEKNGMTLYTAEFTVSKFEAQCQEVYDLEKLNHKYQVSYEFTADGKSCTATAICDNDNSHKITETVDTVGDTVKKATCIENGLTVYTATFENELFAKQTKEIVDTAAGEHSYSEFVSNGDAAEGVDGTKTAKCEKCGETITVTDEGSALYVCPVHEWLEEMEVKYADQPVLLKICQVIHTIVHAICDFYVNTLLPIPFVAKCATAISTATATVKESFENMFAEK